MGSQSKRFRASETTVDSEVVYLYLFLFLCLGFLSRPADYSHTNQRDYRESWNLEQGPSEILAIANPGAFVLEQMASKVIALANSASNYFGSTGKYFSASDFWGIGAEWESEFGPSGTLNMFEPSIEYDYYSLDRHKLYLSGDVLPLLWSVPNETHFLDVLEHDRYHLFGRSAFDCSIDETPWRHESIDIMGFKKKLCHVEKCFNKTSVPCPRPYFDLGLSPDNDLELTAKVISIILAGIFTLVIILIMTWKRIRHVILFKSTNDLDAFILEESDLDESYLADQILYENLLREAVLISSNGSSGKVFKVRFLGLERAMKVFHSSARMDFRKESITLLKLSHPHIVKFFCVFRKSLIVMELMDEDLYSFITKIRERCIDYDMPLEVALDVMLQIAEGMSYLHHQGIAHQDLKSLNILLKLRGEFHDPDFQTIAKVADFGSARRFNRRYVSSGFVLFPNMNIGTRSWRAPELLPPRGSSWTRFLGVNPRVLPKPLDIYGFAVICSELLTKQIPFSTDQDLQLAALASKVREGHRPALPSTGCPEGLLSLIQDCWHRDPVLRPEFHEVCARLIEVKNHL